MTADPDDLGHLDEARSFAVEIAQRAGRLTLEHFQTGLEVESKADGTPVTRADRDAETLLRREIRRRYSDDGLLGEEHGEEPGTSGRTWILDPIDGTKAFVHGVPLYSVLVGLAEENEAGERDVVAGVIHLPALGETLSARRGGGTLWSSRAGERRARVSAVDRVSGAFVTTSDFPGMEQPEGVERLYAEARLRRTWGDAYGYALVATGRADVMVDPVVEPWDLAAVVPVVEEAGGRFTATDGRRGPWHGSGLATNGRLHDEALALLGA